MRQIPAFVSIMLPILLLAGCGERNEQDGPIPPKTAPTDNAARPDKTPQADGTLKVEETPQVIETPKVDEAVTDSNSLESVEDTKAAVAWFKQNRPLLREMLDSIKKNVKLPSERYNKNHAFLQEMASLMEDAVTAMESVKDVETAKTAATKINANCDRLSTLATKIKDLPKVTVPQQKKLNAEFAGKLTAIGERLHAAVLKANTASGGDSEFQTAINQYIKCMLAFHQAAQRAGH